MSMHHKIAFRRTETLRLLTRCTGIGLAPHPSLSDAYEHTEMIAHVQKVRHIQKTTPPSTASQVTWETTTLAYERLRESLETVSGDWDHLAIVGSVLRA